MADSGLLSALYLNSMTATPRVEGWEQLTLRLSGLGSSCVAQARLLIIN